jgi:hypothetical protein
MAAGSLPLLITKQEQYFKKQRVISSVVEQLAVNQKVDGSIPSLPLASIQIFDIA